MKQELKMGVWEHYKHNKYLVVGLARHTENEEDLVMYIPLYDPENAPSRIWARPLSMWFETVEWEGKTVPRFTYLGER